MLRTESQAIVALADQLDDTFCDAVDCVLAAHCSVIVTGMGKAGLVGQKIAATLASTGTRSHFLHPAEAIHGDLGRVGRDDVVMMLANRHMRVALVTTHLPLRDVADAITGTKILRTLDIMHRALRTDFGIDRPRIVVLGLNPHAGESGHLGQEELTIIEPALDAARAGGMDITGPLPADTAFLPHHVAAADAVLAMYHDQGLPVLKYSGFEHGVNMTLGLPYPRVAVDHGTALDLAGKGLADAGSLSEAEKLCSAFAAQRAAAT